MNRRRALVVLGTATVAFTIVLYLLDPHVRGYGGTSISGFEFAGSSSRAAQIIAEWGTEGRHLARIGLWLDYGYMLSYGLFFALAGFAVRDTARARGWRRMAKAGAVVPYFALVAACFDASENVALLLTLGGHGGRFAPPFATACSSIKWLLIGTAILYAICGLALVLKVRLFGSARPADIARSARGRPAVREKVSIRKAEIADVRRIAEIHVRSWQAAYRGILPDALLDGLSVPEREQSWRALIAGRGESWLTLVAERAEELVGFSSVATPSRDPAEREGTVEIGALYVEPDCWRQGAGRSMLATALKELREQGWREAMLWVLPENCAAIDFYRHFGFEIEEGVERIEERSGHPVIQLRVGL